MSLLLTIILQSSNRRQNHYQLYTLLLSQFLKKNKKQKPVYLVVVCFCVTEMLVGAFCEQPVGYLTFSLALCVSCARVGGVAVHNT